MGKKLAKTIIISLFMFMLGFFSMENLRSLNKKDKALILAEQINARNSVRTNETLDYKDIIFLEDHVWGEWKFSEKIDSPISCIGEKEIQSVHVVYDKDFVKAEGYDQNTFSNAEDIFWYTKYNGNEQASLPVYHIIGDEAEADWRLAPLVNDSEIVQVYYDLGYDANYKPSVRELFPFQGTIYVDPDNINSLYLSFCGLWEMERVLDDEKRGR